MKTKIQTVNIQNKKARFEFEILDKYTAGIVLRGTEIKAIREGKASIVFTTDKGFAKMIVALAKGKKLYDKRETIKDRDNKKDLARLKKNFNS